MSTAHLASDLAPTAQMVLTELQRADRPLSPTVLQERTGRPESSVREALRTLRNHGLIDWRPGYRDARRRLYFTDE